MVDSGLGWGQGVCVGGIGLARVRDKDFKGELFKAVRPLRGNTKGHLVWTVIFFLLDLHPVLTEVCTLLFSDNRRV